MRHRAWVQASHEPFGLTLSSEEHALAASSTSPPWPRPHGFDFVSISDHYHPWVDAQGHAPFVWSILGAIAERTDRSEVGIGVTCPTFRIHPAILAQAAGDERHLLEGRFTWGVGTGEALNEHILGDRWPPADHAPRDARGGRRDRPQAVVAARRSTTAASTTSSRTPGSTTRR